MAVARRLLSLAVLLLLSSGLHCSSACPGPCTCQGAPLLNCSSSGLSSVPQHIQDSVTLLDLSHNLLGSVTLRRAHRNLRNVWLGSNSITHLSLCIERNMGSQSVTNRHPRRLKPWSRRGCVSWAPSLQLLSAERNQLEQLPEGLQGSKSLQVLQLSFNRISALRPGDVANLPQLRELHLQHNQITSVHPQVFEDLAQLRVLDLSFNMLTSLHPSVYPPLRNIGAEVRLDGNPWCCDCTMRGLRRRMMYDSSRGVQAWRLLCDSPPMLSGKDLLQLEEEDLNCSSSANMPVLHRDVTVYSGSEILLSCSTQDPVWWTPSGQTPASQPQVRSDITARDAGLYVCASGDHRVVSVFYLQISKMQGTARRSTRSLSRSNQETQQPKTQSDLTLAVCLSVFITFLIAFILGVLARPCIDVLWKRVTTKKRPSAANSGSSVEQPQYDNEAYSGDEEPGEIPPHRERRVTFSTVDIREDNYYDAVASGGREGITKGAVVECEVEKRQTAGDSASKSTLTRNTGPSVVPRGGRTQNMEIEPIPDAAELEERSSSCSDSSVSDKVSREKQMSQSDPTMTKPPQLEKASAQQRPDFPTAAKRQVKQTSLEDTRPEFTSEPFAGWSPHTDNSPSKDFDLWQEKEEQFEFSDSLRSTSERSSPVFDPSDHVAPTSHNRKTDDTSSSSSYVSEGEPTQYTVNSDHEEEENRVPSLSSNSSSSSDSEDETAHHVTPGTMNTAGLPSQKSPNSAHSLQTQLPAVDLEHIPHIKRRLDIKAPSLGSDSSSSSDSEGEARGNTEKLRPGKVDAAELQFQESPLLSAKPTTSFPALDLERVPRVQRRLDIKAPSLDPDSSSSSDSEDEARGHAERWKPGKVDVTYTEPQTPSDPVNKWPVIDLGRIPRIKRRLDIQASSPASSSPSSSDSEDEETTHTKQGEIHMATRWPVIDLEQTTRIKRRLDIRAPSPDSDSSSSSGSEEQRTGHTGKRSPTKLDVAELPAHAARWPVVDCEHLPRIKRRLDIRAPSPDSSSSSGSEDEVASHIKKPEQDHKKVELESDSSSSSDSEEEADQDQMQRPLLEVSIAAQNLNNLDAKWPTIDLERVPHLKRRLDIKILPPHSPPDSETETHAKRDLSKPPFKNLETDDRQNVKAKWPALDFENISVKAPSRDSDSSSDSDSENETICRTERPEEVNMEEAASQKSPKAIDLNTRWPAVNLTNITGVKRRLDIKSLSAPHELLLTGGSENSEEANKSGLYHSSSSSDEEDKIKGTLDPRWPNLDLTRVTHVKRRLDIKACAPSRGSSSSSDSATANLNVDRDRSDAWMKEYGQKTKLDEQKVGFPHITRRLDVKARPPSDLDPSPASAGSQQSSSDSSSSDSEHENTKGIRVSKSLLINTSDHSKPEANIRLEKYTVITDSSSSMNDNSNTTAEITPELESRWATMNLGISRFRKRLEITPRSPPLSPGGGNKAKGWRATPQPPVDTDKVVESDSVWPKWSPSGTSDHAQTESSTSSSGSEDDTIHRSAPQPSLGVPRVKRYLNIKAPSPDQSGSSSSCSDGEGQVKRLTTQGSKHAPNDSGMTDDESVVTYSRCIMKPPSPASQRQPITAHHDEMGPVAQEGPSSVADTNESLFPRRVLSFNFDDVVNKRINHYGSATDPPQTRWAGIGRHLSDLSAYSSRQKLDADASSPQPDNSTGRTNEILKTLSEEKREKKGLSALKVMSSERRTWDADGALDLGPQQRDTGFNHRSSQEDVMLQDKPLNQLLVSSTATDEKRASGLLYGIARYGRHDADIGPPQEAPPPVPDTPPPDEAAELAWRSPQRNRDASSSLTPQSLVHYFDSSKMDFSDV